uniref:Inward rectifier potassium channel 3 n=1 Tax=Nilaparvata lugens TaxID=108931 RepID=A0A9E8G1V0_NILLU|nr:inward rectifier potassium channel 3 [Nilaparvata lugens]
MESQQFTEEEGQNYVSSSSDEALPGIVSEKIHLTNSNYDVSPKMRRRAILKDGYTNMFNSNVPLAGLTSITQDFFTFMMECRWRTLLLLFFTSFLISWLIFAALYWAVAFGHGDLRGYEELHDPTKEPCVTMMDDFISCFLFSMETQYSSGYGTRSPTTECPEAVFLVGFQSIFGALLQLSMSGIIFAKFARPKMRQQAIMFSEKAVISLRDRSLCLMFRVGDCRKFRLLGATLNARLLQHRVSAEGEKLPHYQHDLKLSVDSSGSNVFLLWPLTAVHRIDATSPLYDISADDLASATFEIFVALSGTVETMGQDTEARTSYTAAEILWGHRLVPLVKTCGRGYILDYSRFHTTFPVDTPRCSARQLYCWTHNYVLLNKGGLLGHADGFLEQRKYYPQDEFPEKDNKFLDTKERGASDKEGFLGNDEKFLEGRVGILEENDGFLPNQHESLDNRDRTPCNNSVLWSTNGLSANDGDVEDRLMDCNNQQLSTTKYPLSGNVDENLDKNILMRDDNRLSNNKDELQEISTGRDRILDRKNEYLGSKKALPVDDLLLDNRDVLLDRKGDRLLNNKDQYHNHNNHEFLGGKEGAEHREENERVQNLSNSCVPVRKFSTILRDGPERELHHSLISLHDRKQRTRLTTLSEDDLR